MRELLRYLEEAAPEPGSAAWLAGVRKWWAQWVQGAAKVAKIREPGERPQVLAWFAEGEQRIAALKDALVRAAGVAVPRDVAKAALAAMERRPFKAGAYAVLRMPARVAGHALSKAPEQGILPHLDVAHKALQGMVSREQHWFDLEYPGSEAKRAFNDKMGERSRTASTDEGELNSWQLEMRNEVEAVQAVDIEVQAALRSYLKLLKALPSTAAVVTGAPPLEYRLGKMTVVTDPGEYGSLSGLARSDDIAGVPIGQRSVTPEAMQAVRAGLQDAQRALAKRGMDDVWYGAIFIRPAGRALTLRAAKSGVHFKVSGHYNPSEEIVLNPEAWWTPKVVAEIAVHELGHRYWYKVMKAGARARFAAWFDPRTKAQQDAAGPQAGYVPAPTAYGAESPVEEFAEVFAAYVLGRYNGIELTGPQRARFEALARGRAAQSEERTMRALLRRLEESERGMKAALTRLNRAAEQRAGTERFAEQAMEELLTAIVQRAKDGGYYHLKLGSSTAQKAYNEGWKMVREALSALGKAGQGEDGGGIDAAMFALRRAKDAFYRVFVLIAKDADNKSDLSLINGIRDEIDAAWETARLSLGM